MAARPKPDYSSVETVTVSRAWRSELFASGEWSKQKNNQVLVAYNAKIKTMKIFFDARWTRTDRHDGVSRYSANLLGALARIHPVTAIIHNKDQLKLLPEGIDYTILNNPFSPRELFMGYTLNKLGADVVFSPLQYMGGLGRKYKLILTIHDLIYYRHPKPPGFLPLPVRMVWRLYHLTFGPQRWLLNRADHVAAVSETTKRYMLKHRITKHPIDVVYNAPQETFLRPTKLQKTPTKDIVFMGSFMPYKNVECLIQSLEFLPGYTLHLLSKIVPERKAELLELAPKGAKIKFWNGISDEAYCALLAHATALVSASKEEGFGLPLVEGMMQGVPVVCSDIEIFHEVAGKAALFFDPNSPKECAKQIHKLENPKLRAELIKKGPKQASKFSWDNSAEALLATMKRLYKQ
ncbi:glycosyl transferase, group 1 [candidate division TM7 genomosp. GTL1]|nr:glycosyl transferase, group 1 [candidate division TM7 genomosp. GTL1]